MPRVVVVVIIIISFLFRMASTSCFLHHRTTTTSFQSRHHDPNRIPAACCHLFGEASNYEKDIPITTSSTAWEERLRQEATEALLPVFFPKELPTKYKNDDDGVNDLGRERKKCTILSAELSLKRLLRNKYRRATNENDADGITSKGGADTAILATASNASRRRLAALVLGTSIMRLRHWYSVVFVVGSGNSSCPTMDIMHHKQQQLRNSTKLPFHLLIPYPLDSYSLDMLIPCNNIDGNGGSGGAASVDSREEILMPSHNDIGNFSTGERSLVRAMVDEHARYLSSQTLMSDDRNNDHEDNDALSIHLQSTASLSTDMLLSVQHSLPPFLTSSLLFQYGIERTKQICKVLNRPGPITLRRNAIRFSGTDDELCRWLKKEDEIDVRRMRWVEAGEEAKWDGRGENNNLLMTATSDGSNNYIVCSASSFGPGNVMPPDGAIELTSFDTTKTTMLTTAEQQHHRRKSIWSTAGWKKGYFEVQDVGSQIIVSSIGAAPGMTILDYCAGNGGKTFGLASSIMANAITGSHLPTVGGHSTYSKIVAHDIVEARLRQIEGSMMRAGFAIHHNGKGGMGGRSSYIVQNIHGDQNCTIQLATTTDLADCQNDSTSTVSPPPLRFDAVLVDAPCSSTGVLRRRPSQRWDLAEDQIYKALPKLQLEILAKAASYVEDDGGRLVYSTCSLLREENECVASMFELSDTYREGDFERWDFVPIVTSDDHFYVEKSAVDYDDRGTFAKERFSNTITLLPTERSDGFFIARWRRRKNWK